MRFRKMHGLGNDFVIFDARQEDLFITPDDMELIADRHWGVGCDLITILDQSDSADVRAYFFNADGSESAACGNASRCVADIVMADLGKDECSIEVNDRTLTCKKTGEFMVEVNMGKARGITEPDLSKDAYKEPVAVDMGNPHLVFFVDDIEAVDVAEVGSYFENHVYFPSRTNVEFVQVIDKGHLRQRTWERGVGITEACGSGACAVASAAIHRGLCDDKVEIMLDGGPLTVEKTKDGELLMNGPVAYVFDGTLNTV
ncbi:MAG: diaminopimelate epimerase [Alcanivorax sp.]